MMPKVRSVSYLQEKMKCQVGKNDHFGMNDLSSSGRPSDFDKHDY